MHNKQLITIKGTKDGLTLFIDDTCLFDDAFIELHDKLIENHPIKKEPTVPVTVKLGNRYLHESEKKRLRKLVNGDSRFFIKSLESDVVAKKDALIWQRESEVQVINQVVRSGQVVKIHGDMLLIGDVNPGGKVVATGNIFVMGCLRGIAHAGVDGDMDAVITASYMNPNQLRIADYISRAPDYDSDGVYLECGIIDRKLNKIVIDHLNVLTRSKKDLSGFERRMLNG